MSNGWSLISRGAVPALPADKIRQIEKNVNGSDITTGAVVAGKRNRYPESATAGLYTNVIDLCRLIQWINRAWTAPGNITGPLTKTWVTTMLSQGATPGMGRGFFTANSGTSNFLYNHNGDNKGFKANFVGYPNLGTGFAVMANGDSMGLVTEVSNAVKAAYGWA
ncbi:hypothetical protein Cs7R123_00780 [Catellatospora sp. TT07R-123]|nr:hypothetical protein Cs7R123_00780 [Catellatospora sp. TT07R-123]